MKERNMNFNRDCKRTQTWAKDTVFKQTRCYLVLTSWLWVMTSRRYVGTRYVHPQNKQINTHRFLCVHFVREMRNMLPRSGKQTKKMKHENKPRTHTVKILRVYLCKEVPNLIYFLCIFLSGFMRSTLVFFIIHSFHSPHIIPLAGHRRPLRIGEQGPYLPREPSGQTHY